MDRLAAPECPSGCNHRRRHHRFPKPTIELNESRRWTMPAPWTRLRPAGFGGAHRALEDAVERPGVFHIAHAAIIMVTGDDWVPGEEAGMRTRAKPQAEQEDLEPRAKRPFP